MAHRIVRIMYFLEGAIDAGVGQTVTFSHRKASPSAIYATLVRGGAFCNVDIQKMSIQLGSHCE